MAGAGDGIEAQLVGFALGVRALGDDADGLTFDVFQMGIASAEVKGDVLNPTNGPFIEKAVVLGDGADER